MKITLNKFINENKNYMTINQFVKDFTINPMVDIEPNFKLTKELEVDTTKIKECYNCGDKLNNVKLKSIDWTNVQYCWHCNHLNVIYEQDRMSGVYVDIVKCYTDKR
jgi:hypothetical protein